MLFYVGLKGHRGRASLDRDRKLVPKGCGVYGKGLLQEFAVDHKYFKSRNYARPPRALEGRKNIEVKTSITNKNGSKLIIIIVELHTKYKLKFANFDKLYFPATYNPETSTDGLVP